MSGEPDRMQAGYDFAAIPPNELREELVRRLTRPGAGGVPPPGLLDTLLQHARVMPAWDRLKPVLLDTSQPRALRASLSIRVVDEDQESWEAMLEADELPVEDETLPLEALARLHLLGLTFEPDGASLVQLLSQVAVDFAPTLAPRIETIRRELHLSALSTYGAALESAALAPFHAPMLQAVALEASPAGVALLERLRDEAEGPRRREIQKALLKAHTQIIDPAPGTRTVPEGEAWVSSTDPEGRFVILMRLPQEDGREHVLNLQLSYSGLLPAGGLVFNQGPALLPKMLEPFLKSPVVTTPVPLAEAGHVVRRLVETGRLDVVPNEQRAAVELVLQFAGTAPSAALTAPAPDPTKEAFATLVTGRAYRTWGPALGQLLRAPVAEQIPSQATVLVRHLEAACEHMARWHGWRGESEAAALMASATEAGERRGLVPLLQAIAEQFKRNAPAPGQG